jgi:hypothetical protein
MQILLQFLIKSNKKNDIKGRQCLYFLSYCSYVIEILDFKNSIWLLIHTRILTYDMSTMDLMNEKTCYIIIALEKVILLSFWK